MNHLMKYLLSALVMLTAFHAQAQMADPAQTLSTLVFGKFDGDQSKAYTQLFMKKAELVDASGKVWKGRKAILEWHETPASESGLTLPSEKSLLEHHIRLIRPDLAVAVATLRSLSGAATYHCICRRVDGRWYIETCSITPVSEPAAEVSIR